MNASLAREGSPVLPSPSRARGAGACLACIDARDPAAWRLVAGLTPVQRLVRSLELEGVVEIVVLSCVPRDASALGARRRGTRARIELAAAEAPLSDAMRQSGPSDDVLAVDGGLVVDRRLLAALLRAGRTLVVWPAPDRAGQLGRVRLARLEPGRLDLLGRAMDPLDDVACLDPRTLPLDVAEMRGPVPILLFDVTTPSAAARAERALLRSTQKHVMDAPARWIDPIPEEWLLRRLAPTRVTPNAVTLAACVIGALASWMLWNGWLWAALPSMLLVGWLDGVDGKLARLTLHYTRFGAADSLLDFAVETSWWLVLTRHLAEAHGVAAYLAGAALLGGNLADEVAYTIGHARLGRALDLLSPADRAFRLVAGRRNVYVWMLCLAAVAGSAWHGFVACGLWALATATVHALRLGHALRRPEPVEDAA